MRPRSWRGASFIRAILEQYFLIRTYGLDGLAGSRETRREDGILPSPRWWSVGRLTVSPAVRNALVHRTLPRLLAFVVILLKPFGPTHLVAESCPYPNISSRVLSILSEVEARREARMEAPQWFGPLKGARVDNTGRLEVMPNHGDHRGCVEGVGGSRQRNRDL